MSKIKNIVLLGSTGSIGKSTLEVVRFHAPLFRVIGLAAYGHIDLLEAQAKEFHPEVIAVYDPKKAKELSDRLITAKLPHIRVIAGMEGLEEVASLPHADVCVSAIAGSIGIRPTVRALQAGHTVALANKEVLVSAGDFITKLAKEKGVSILPIDSEQSAIFQCLEGRQPEEVDRIILTASGGPFLHRKGDLSTITVEEALKHPSWKMGSKVTIDSSTLMNKGLEVIEAYWLFNISLDKIDVVIHPQSLIHSLVEFIDGSLLAQIAENQMIVPIQYALSYPQRIPRIVDRFDFRKYSTLQFYEPDRERFTCLGLAYEAAKIGGSLPCFMNAANEVLVERFLKGLISWTDIAKKLESLMQVHVVQRDLGLEDILYVDQEAREEAFHA